MSNFYYGTKPINGIGVSFSSKSGGTDTSDATITSGDQMLQGVTAYGASGKLTGTILTKSNTDVVVNENIVTIPSGYYGSDINATINKVALSSPTVTLDNSNGLVTANINQSSGYVTGTTKSATLQLNTKAAASYTPTKLTQTISGGVYLTGDQTINPIPSNYIDTTDATAAANDIASGKTAYINGAKVTGTHECATPTLQSKTVTPTKSSQTVTADVGYDALSDVIVNAIPSNYIDTTDATAVASDILSGTTAYVNGSKVTGSMVNNSAISKTLDTNTTSYTIPNGYHNGNGIVNILTEIKTITPSTSTQAVSASNGKVISSVTVNPIPSNFIDIDSNTVTAPTPTISVSAVGLITASINNPKGYQANATTKSATQQLTVKAAATYTPSTVDQTIASGQYLTGTQTIRGDANLVAENIASGVSIFGVTGTHEGGSGIDTSDADATSADIIKDKTAYVNGVKLTGTLEVQNYYTGSTVPESSLGNDGDLYFKV